MGIYRKKPIEIEARLFTDVKSGCDILDWSDWKVALGSHEIEEGKRIPFLEIQTLEGLMRAEVGDWIIKGVKGEFYPIKDEIFRETYEGVTDV